MRLLLIADTHVPMRARDLPRRVWDEVADADVVLHAGDWVEPELLDQLEARAARLVACWGKNDGAELRRRALSRYLKYIVAQLIVELWRWISVGALVFQAAASSEVASRQTAKR